MPYQCPNCSSTKFVLVEDVNVESQLVTLVIKPIKEKRLILKSFLYPLPN